MENKNFKHKTIGILGGMGPQASASLLQVLINMAAKEFGVKKDSEFPQIILASLQVPNFISSKKKAKAAFTILKEKIKKIETFNPSCFGIACNTAHILLGDLEKETLVPFVSIIEEVRERVKLAGIKRIGLLGTPVTIDSGLYKKVLAKENIKTITPSKMETEIVEKVIRNVLAGKKIKKDKQKLILIAESLQKRGAGGIILGCTELPLIFPKNFNLPIFDSIDILARGLLQKAYE